ncbi:hypothetical protein NFI96_018069 [Prochilodus magdalenae]|nr:hypothetical protein NFI96_018069 [Prochilodus magdalenae]
MAKSELLQPEASSEKKKLKQAKEKKKTKRKKTENEESETCAPAEVTEVKKKKADINDITTPKSKKKKKQRETKNKQSSDESASPVEADQPAEPQLDGVEEGEDDLSPEEKRVLERKLKKIRRKDEKRKQKEKEKNEKEETKSSESSVAQTQALEYLKCWSEKREEWKFQKTRQVWLLQHMYDSEKVSDAHFSVLLSYLEGLQGVARETTVQKAEALVRWGGQEEEESEATEAERRAHRAKERLIPGLSESVHYVTGGPCPSQAKIPGKTVVITGANAGIGKETARELAKRGGRIIMGCRDMEKCEAAAREIRGSTLNPHVYARHIDLASMKSIRSFAKMINQEEKRVDILINNAAVMRCPPGKTEDGFDMQLGVNYLGHFLLTNLLLDKMRDSAPSRVINLSSLAHIVGDIDFTDLNWDRKKFDTKKAYCQSKLAIVLFTRELARRLEGTGVTVNALHPGVVATELGRHTGMHQSQFSSTVLSPFFYLLIKSPELGAQPSVYLAVAEELEGVTGCYYDVLTEKEPAPKALDQEVAVKLWDISASLVGLETTVPEPVSTETETHSRPVAADSKQTRPVETMTTA